MTLRPCARPLRISGLLVLLAGVALGTACGPDPSREPSADDTLDRRESALTTFVSQLPTYGAIFVQSSDSATLSGLGMSPSSLQNFLSVQATSGRHMASLTSAVVNGVVQYNAVVQTGVVAQKLTLGRTLTQLQSDQTMMAQQGYIPYYICANVVSGQVLYNMLWNKANNTPPLLLLQQSALNFGVTVASKGSQGYKLISMATTVVDGTPLYHGTMISNQSFGATAVFLGRSSTDLQDLINTQQAAGRPCTS